MKKGKKMPSIELDGQSDASFVLIDGKIIRAEQPRRESSQPAGPGPSFSRLERD
jgi:hypothetical protein